MKKSVALIGGSGFIGTNLTNFFLSNNYSVINVDKNPNRNIPTSTDYFVQRLLDVNKTSELIDSVYNTDNIIWLVSDLIPSASMDSLVDDFTFNINPLIKFLENGHLLKNLKKFVFISSGGAIYGDSANNYSFTESSPLNPVSAYGLSKLIAEKYIHFVNRNAHFSSVILRPSNVYGDYQNLIKPQGIVGVAFKAILDRKPIELYNGGMIVRDFIHVLDFAVAIKYCIEAETKKAFVDTYNIGSNHGVSIVQILDMVNEISKSKIETIIKPARTVDCNYSVLDTTHIKKKLNWEPQIPLNEGLSSVWSWIQKK